MEDCQLLLNEVQHRVSNDLLLVLALVEAERQGGGSADEALDSAVASLLSMAGYYRSLYESVSTDLLDLAAHLDRLLDGLRRTYLDRLGVTVVPQLEPIFAPPPLARDVGMVVVEAVVNAAKHAFTPGARGRVWVQLASGPAGFVCSISDDGGGLDPSAVHRHAGGLALASRFAARLGGRFDIFATAEHGGAAFVLSVPLPGAAASGVARPN
jgi:two-component system, sensor histidine kinase PdtaS